MYEPLRDKAIRRSCILICALVAGCAHYVAISYHGKSETNPDFTKPDIIWNGEQVQVELTPALRAEALKYLVKSDQVLLANSIQVKGLRHDYKIAIFLAVPHRGSWLAGGVIGSVGNRLIRHAKNPAHAMKELAAQYPGILDPYFARANARGGPTSLFWLAPNPLLDGLAGLPIKVPFHSIIGNLGEDDGADSTDGVVAYYSSHLEGPPLMISSIRTVSDKTGNWICASLQLAFAKLRP